MPSQKMRKTRFVCVSDTHNATPGGAFQLPRGDVLIHAGDLTNQGSFSELEKTVKWIEDADFECKIVIAGNHDITLDTAFYTEHGSSFHNQNPQDSSKCMGLVAESPFITYLDHEAVVVKLDSENGPHTTFKVFGSPYSPGSGKWAFGYNPEDALSTWDSIPLDADIVLTHTPPKDHLDVRKDGRPVGCKALKEALWRIRPRLAICGHVHEGRGIERLAWDSELFECGLQPWEDPGKNNKKLSLIDLTPKGGNPLDNDGVRGCLGALYHDDACDSENMCRNTSPRDTCLVNCAMMASSWPHGSGGGKKFNKPIVVDIDLPVWE